MSSGHGNVVKETVDCPNIENLLIGCQPFQTFQGIRQQECAYLSHFNIHSSSTNPSMSDILEVDPDCYDARPYKPGDFESETTSLASTIYRGVFENGRRYQVVKEGRSWCPSDEQQWESLEAGHLIAIILDSDRENPLFYAPIENPKHILDIGTGRGSWAVDTADLFPETIVRGVDLFPPPGEWLPPNCIMEVDDILQEWTWRDPFDLIHLRHMLGSFTPEEWDIVYKHCYDNLKPGSWIEHLEMDPRISCSDNSLPKDAYTPNFSERVLDAAENWNHPLDTVRTMRQSLEKAGFVDIHEKRYRCPIGPWARDATLKEAGRLHYHHWATGMEGWAMFMLTKWGSPKPWTKEEVQVLVAKVRGS
ncbi:hypothetical protein N7499_009223 [Penicillium canescens]|nr:hypothetical protein N7499_009223 [Penicillium canescens]